MTSVTTDRRQGLNSSAAIKVPCLVATTGNIALSGLQTIDGVALAAGDRVLVKSQTDATENGIYDADTGNWTRSLDFDGTYDAVTGTIAMVRSGTANANTYWRLATTGTITFGSSSIAFAQALTGDAALLSFIQTGANAIERSMQDKARDVYNAQDYQNDDGSALTTGGVADNLDSLVNAAASANGENTGGTLHLPAGIIGMEESVAGFGWYWNTPARIKGAGVEKTTLKNLSATGATVRMGAGYQTISDVTIDGNSSTGNALSTYGQYSQVRDVLVRNQGGSSFGTTIDGATLSLHYNINHIGCTNGIDIGPSINTFYPTFLIPTVEWSTGNAFATGRNGQAVAALRCFGLYMEPTAGAGNIARAMDLNNIEQGDFFATSAEYGSGTLTSDENHKVTNCRSLNFIGGRLNVNNTASKLVFNLAGTTTQNITFQGWEIKTTKTGMTAFDNNATGLRGFNVRDIRTNHTSAAAGVVHTQIPSMVSIENWIDGDQASYHVLKGANLWVKNVEGNIALTAADYQTLVNCSGTISGTGLDTSVQINCAGRAAVQAGTDRDVAAVRAYAGNAAYTDQLFSGYVNRASGTGYNFAYFTNTTGAMFKINGAGDVTNQNNSYGAISDRKLKQDERLAPSQYADVKALAALLKKYRLKAAPDLEQLGLVAQDVEEVSPGLVGETEDFEERHEVRTHRVVRDGQEVDEEYIATVRVPLGTTTKHIKYSILPLKMLGAMGEMMAEIEALRNEIAALKA